MLHFHIISIFPESFDSYLNSSMLWRAQKEKKIKVSFYNPRNYSLDKHKKVDSRPYGGGPGMVLQVEPIIRTIKDIRKKISRKYSKLISNSLNKKIKIIITSPAGKIFDNKLAKDLSLKTSDLIIICGHYEGIDARVKKVLVGLKDPLLSRIEEVSVGPYVLTGGELPALIMIDAIARQIPGVLGNNESLEEKRFSSSEMYTRPEILEIKDFSGKIKSYRTPKILLSGHHSEIEKWKKQRRPSKPLF